MRYLIFNITVLAALGYLFTAAPNQSFTQWVTSTLDIWGNANNAEAAIASDSVAESGKTFAKAVAKAASERLGALDDKIADPNPLQTTPQQGATSMGVDEIKQLVITAMKEAEAERLTPAPAKPIEMTQPLHASETDIAAGKTGNVSPPFEKSKVPDGMVQQQPPKDPEQMNDSEIAAAFNAFEKTENDAPERAGNVVFQKRDAARPVKQAPAFMSPTQRAEDMSRIIQQLNMLYLEKTGI